MPGARAKAPASAEREGDDGNGEDVPPVPPHGAADEPAPDRLPAPQDVAELVNYILVAALRPPGGRAVRAMAAAAAMASRRAAVHDATRAAHTAGPVEGALWGGGDGGGVGDGGSGGGGGGASGGSGGGGGAPDDWRNRGDVFGVVGILPKLHNPANGGARPEPAGAAALGRLAPLADEDGDADENSLVPPMPSEWPLCMRCEAR